MISRICHNRENSFFIKIYDLDEFGSSYFIISWDAGTACIICPGRINSFHDITFAVNDIDFAWCVIIIPVCIFSQIWQYERFVPSFSFYQFAAFWKSILVYKFLSSISGSNLNKNSECFIPKQRPPLRIQELSHGNDTAAGADADAQRHEDPGQIMDQEFLGEHRDVQY